MVLSKSICLPLLFESLPSSVHLALMKRLTQGEQIIYVYVSSEKFGLTDQCHFWQHFQESHGPSWSCRPSCPSRIPPSSQKTSSSLRASCPSGEPSSCSSGTQCEFLPHQEPRSWSFGFGVVSDLCISCRCCLLSLWCLVGSRRSPSTCQ